MFFFSRERDAEWRRRQRGSVRVREHVCLWDRAERVHLCYRGLKRQDVILFFIFLLLVKFSLLLLYIMKINESSILICLDAFLQLVASTYKPRSDFKLTLSRVLFTCQSSFTSSEAISLAIIALCCVISLFTVHCWHHIIMTLQSGVVVGPSAVNCNHNRIHYPSQESP